MNTYIALLRGINVGGKNLLPMRELTAHLEAIGSKKVRTYVQSGNAVFENSKKDTQQMAKQLAAEIVKHRGFEPQVLVLEARALTDATTKNPFPKAEGNPATLHIGFLASKPKAPKIEELNRLKEPSERFQLTDQIFYLHAPEGFGRSKLAANSERLLGIPLTYRNWRTVCEIKKLVDAIG